MALRKNNFTSFFYIYAYNVTYLILDFVKKYKVISLQKQVNVWWYYIELTLDRLTTHAHKKKNLISNVGAIGMLSFINAGLMCLVWIRMVHQHHSKPNCFNRIHRYKGKQHYITQCRSKFKIRGTGSLCFLGRSNKENKC